MEATTCPRCNESLPAARNFCANCGLARDEFPRAESGQNHHKAHEHRAWYSNPARVRFAGQLLASAMSGALTASIALFLAFYVFSDDASFFSGPPRVVVITPSPFEERTSLGPINASAVVPMADSTFLVIDDLTDDAFYELTFSGDGKKARPLVRRPVAGLASRVVQDLEGSTLVTAGGQRYIIASSSLEKTEGENTEAGLVRISVGAGGEMRAEAMKGFRKWLVSSFPELAAIPDGVDALDVQGLAWDPKRNALLFGVRSAAPDGKPLVLVVKVKDWSAPWSVDVLERMGVVSLDVPVPAPAKGIYGMTAHPSQASFLIVIGEATGAHTNASLFTWDGGDAGAVKLAPDIVFHPDSKPEGLAFGTIGGKPALVIVDDNGGYYVLWQDGHTSQDP